MSRIDDHTLDGIAGGIMSLRDFYNGVRNAYREARDAWDDLNDALGGGR